MSTRMAEPFPLGLSLLAVDDVRRAVLEEVHAAALCQLKAVSTAWCTHARRELCTRLCRYEGDGITDVDVECLNDAGRPWEVVIAGRQLPQLARLRGFSFVVDVQAVRGADLREADRGAAARDAPLGCLALSGCIEGEGDPPRELLLAAVACAASGWALGVPVQELREDKDYGLSCRGLGVIGVGLLALTLPGATSLRSLSLEHSQLCGLNDMTYTDEGITKLCEGLVGSAVTSLKLIDNSLGGYYDKDHNFVANTEGITKLSEALKGSAVTSLNISSNYLGFKGVAALAKGLKGNTTLRSLNLERNRIGYGATTFAALLRETQIIHLNLRNNSFNDQSKQAVKDAADSRVTIEF